MYSRKYNQSRRSESTACKKTYVPEVADSPAPGYAESITRLNLEKGRDMLQRITTSEQTSHRNSPASMIFSLEKVHS